jgi:hypothetical protein
MTTPERDDYDHPWKQVIEYAFRPFLAFFFPAAHAGIAWERGYTFLEQELHQITRDADVSTRHVDKLVQVWQAGGQETWLLIHIEVQSQEETGFAERMFTYYYRLYDRYRVPIESLAILGDEGTRWRPTQFQPRVVWETALTFRFRSVKLLDYQAWEALEASDNPFALMVMAHLKTRETKHDGAGRLHWKMTLVRRLYERGYGREDILMLFRFLDWLMWLPEALTTQFWQTLQTYEEAHQMTYITSIERLGIEQGRAEGIEQGRAEGMQQERLHLVLRLLTRRCGALTPATETRIRQLSLGQLEQLAEALLDFTGTDDLDTWLQALPPAE